MLLFLLLFFFLISPSLSDIIVDLFFSCYRIMIIVPLDMIVVAEDNQQTVNGDLVCLVVNKPRQTRGQRMYEDIKQEALYA